jgi:hypothetical protein
MLRMDALVARAFIRRDLTDRAAGKWTRRIDGHDQAVQTNLARGDQTVTSVILPTPSARHANQIRTAGCE